MSKDNIRARAFSSSNTKTKLVTVVMGGEPTVVELAQPSIKARRRLLEIGKLDPDGKTDLIAALAMKAAAVTECARDPDTHVPLFNATDRESLEAQPSGGWLDALGDACLKFMRDQLTVEEAGKNS